MAGVYDSIYTEENERIGFSREFIDHIRFFDDGSGYFFINDFDGVTIAHGADRSLEGNNNYDLQDDHGAYIIRDMIEIVETSNDGYYEYYWTNPASGNEEVKITYVYRIPGTEYFIGAGFYIN